MKQPINRLVMLRARGFFGPLFQKTAPGRFVKSVGNYVGGPIVPVPDGCGFLVQPEVPGDPVSFWVLLESGTGYACLEPQPE